MSASERLAALDAAMRFDMPSDAVLGALPEIVAVVKAAEPHASEGWFRLVAGDDLLEALAALDAKLEEK